MIVLLQPVTWPLPGPRNRQPGPVDAGPHRDVTDRGAATPGQQMRRTLGRCQLGPARPAAQMVLDHGLHCDRLILGQRVDQQLLPPPEPPNRRPPPHPSPERQETKPRGLTWC